jgi:hypothetical protein
MRTKLTQGQKWQITHLSRAGMRVTHIAKALGVTADQVIRWRRSNGLPTKQILPEEKILALIRRGVTFRNIGRQLGVPYRSVSTVARANNIPLTRRPRPISDLQAMGLISDILARKTSAAALARKYNTSYDRVREIAHRLLDVERFLPSKKPLQSYSPKEPLLLGTKNEFETTPPMPVLPRPAVTGDLESAVLQLVDRVVQFFFVGPHRLTADVRERVFEGRLPRPEFEQIFIQAVSSLLDQQYAVCDKFWSCPLEGIKANFEAHMLHAIDTLRLVQDSKWQQ